MFYNGNNLQITRLGEFISEMPCDMKITKMLLLSIELGCFD
jgi:HrpA-like RNA helicase